MAVTFLCLFLAEVVGDPDIATWGDGKVVNVATCLVFVAIATFVAYRGMTATKEVMYVLVTVQMVAPALFVVFALSRAIGGDAATSIDFELSWLSPFSVASFSALATALSLSIFMYWGWDASRARPPPPPVPAYISVSEDVLVDTILSLGLMICFYYGLTATLAAVFVKLVIDTADPSYGSGGSVFGLGTVE